MHVMGFSKTVGRLSLEVAITGTIPSFPLH
jgi:hypothetical protein